MDDLHYSFSVSSGTSLNLALYGIGLDSHHHCSFIVEVDVVVNGNVDAYAVHTKVASWVCVVVRISMRMVDLTPVVCIHLVFCLW